MRPSESLTRWLFVFPERPRHGHGVADAPKRLIVAAGVAGAGGGAPKARAPAANIDGALAPEPPNAGTGGGAADDHDIIEPAIAARLILLHFSRRALFFACIWSRAWRSLVARARAMSSGVRAADCLRAMLWRHAVSSAAAGAAS